MTLKKFLIAAALLCAPIVVRAENAIGPVQTYQFYGCLAGKSCHLITWEVARIPDYWQDGSPTFGVRFFAEHWFETPTYLRRAYRFGYTGAPFLGSASIWDDLDFANKCYLEYAACSGYVKDDSNYRFGFNRVERAWSFDKMNFSIDEFDVARLEDGSWVTTTRYVVPLTGYLVPEPSTYALMASGLAALAIVSRRRRVS